MQLRRAENIVSIQDEELTNMLGMLLSREAPKRVTG